MSDKYTFTCTLLDCAARLHGPIVNGQESTAHAEVLMGNKTNPIEITCHVECLNNTYSHNPAILLVSLEINNLYKDIRTPMPHDASDGLYLNISHPTPTYCSQTNNIMQYSFIIYPTIKMNHTVVRCGVIYFSGRGPCWGEQVVLIQYVNDPIEPTPTPPTCTTPYTTTTTEYSTTTTADEATTTGSNPSMSERQSDQQEVILGASLGTIITVIAIIGVAVFLGILVCKLFTRTKCPMRIAPK